MFIQKSEKENRNFILQDNTKNDRGHIISQYNIIKFFLTQYKQKHLQTYNWKIYPTHKDNDKRQ